MQSSSLVSVITISFLSAGLITLAAGIGIIGKEAQLEEKMLMEKDRQKRKRLSRELEIVNAQHAKGLKTLQSLETG